jgi:uncharacterized protein (TIGR02569 family)
MDDIIQSIAHTFGSDVPPTPLEVGRNKRTYRSGKIVLKSIDSVEENNWLAEIFSQLPKNKNVRVPRPIQSASGHWIENGYVAWSYLEGETVKGRHEEKLMACDAFHEMLTDIPKPDFIDAREHSWAIADRIAWQEVEPDYEEVFMEYIAPLVAQLKPLDLPCQLIHGDLGGNFIFHEKLPPGVIDITLYWRPADFAKAIILVNTVWDPEPFENFKVFSGIPHFKQLLLRAIIRRIAEQPEHVNYFGKAKSEALKVVKKQNEAVRYLDYF